ncbi:MAG: site-specific DNA-methyltransferase [Thermodesulfobacteriota bacterium]
MALPEENQNAAPPEPDHLVVMGDSRAMPELSDSSVHLVVTSPPYWQLKDYGRSGQIGFDDTYEAYINNLNLVWAECMRVLAPGCRLCVNIGDQFARAETYGRYKVIPIRTEIIRFCEAAGFDYMGAVIWRKVTTTNTSGGASIMGSYPYPRNGLIKIDYEFILLFKKPGSCPPPSEESKRRSELSISDWNTYFSGHWAFPGEKQKGHLAMFPLELPLRLIRMFTFEGERVLDPFLGSGTTTLAAMRLKRRSAGYEINPDTEALIREKLGMETPGLFDSLVLQIQKRRGPEDFSVRLSGLAHSFTDVKKMRLSKEKPKKNYGSKVDGTEKPREKYYSVRSVEGPLNIILKNGMRVRLAGLAPVSHLREEAVSWLAGITRGTRIFLREVDRAPDGEVSAYVYLHNRTFVNSRMIRAGLAASDPEADHPKKKRFEKLSEARDRA